jgi:hypothetical protein
MNTTPSLRACFLTSLATLAAASLLAIGCSSSTTPPTSDGGAGTSSPTPSGTPSGTPTGTATPSASHDGAYSGTYSGDDKGPVTMNVSGANVDVVATVGGKQYPGSGTLDAAGAVSVGIGVGGGLIVTFEGSFAGGKGSGTWRSSAGGKGTWSVAR